MVLIEYLAEFKEISIFGVLILKGRRHDDSHPSADEKRGCRWQLHVSELYIRVDSCERQMYFVASKIAQIQLRAHVALSPHGVKRSTGG